MTYVKALHFTPFVFQAGKRGGGERYVQQLCAALELIEVDVSIVECTNFLNFVVWRKGEKVLSTKNFLKIILLTKEFDVVHAHQLNRETFTVSFFSALLTRKPLVLTDHGGKSRNLFRLLGRLRLKSLKAILAVSPWSLADLDPKGVVKVRSVLWGGGEHIHGAKVKDFGTSDFLFLGRILPHKGVHIVIEALDSEKTLVVAGEKLDPRYFNHLLELAEGKNVRFLPAPEDTDLFSLYSSARCLLIPSVHEYGEKKFERPELLGIVALEGLYAKTPIIGSDLGGLGDLLRESNQVLVEPGNVKAWQTAMASFSLKGDDSPSYVSFTWNRAAEICLEAYRNVLR